MLLSNKFLYKNIILVFYFVIIVFLISCGESDKGDESTNISPPSTVTTIPNPKEGLPSEKEPQVQPTITPRPITEQKLQFEGVLEEFDEQKNKTIQEVKEGKEILITFREAVKIAKDRDSEFSKVEFKWNRINTECKNLYNDFEKLVKTADLFFNTLENRAQLIKDKNLKADVLQRLKNTKVRIKELSSLHGTVQDIITALEISFSLTILEERLSGIFDEIDKKITGIMNNLNQLLNDSKALLNEMA